MSHNVLHAVSGGIDSASVLFQLLDAGESPLCFHIRLGTGRVEAEERAAKNIVQWCEQRFGISLTYLTSFQIGNLDGVFDIEAAALVAGGILRNYPAITRVTVSTSHDDRSLPNWTHRHNNRAAITERLANRSIEWMSPNANKSRQEVVQGMPDDLLALCSFCRNPKPEPCEKCFACVRTLKHLRGPDNAR